MTLRVIFFYFLYSAINEYVGFYLYKKKIFISNITFPIFTIIEFSLFCYFFYYTIHQKNIKRLITPLVIFFFVFACADFFLINKMQDFDSIPVGIEAIAIILMCVYYLFIQINGINDLFVYSTSNFWIIITFLIYISGTFFLGIMAENHLDNKIFKAQYIIINSIFNIVKNILFCVAMFMKPVNNDTQKNDKNWDAFLIHNLNS